MTTPETSLHRFAVHMFLAVGLLASGAALTAAETEWPQCRGPTGQGISAAANVPIEWSATEQVAWKVEIPGRGWSSPVASKGRLYLTSAVPDDGSSDVTLHALCVDAADGRV